MNYGTLTVTASTLSANYAGEGGGIYNQSGSTPLYVINSTIADNSAGQGGGIYNYGSNLQVTSSTIAYNVDYSGYGPGIYGQSGPVYLDNTIVAANTIGTGLGAAELDTGGIGYQSSSAYNLIGVDGSGQLSGNGNLIGITNFGLGLLANNGGPTQTIALLAGSPAIGAGNVALAVDQNGNPLTNDQRGTGFPRTINGMVDIGAFERPTTIGAPTVYTVDLTSADGTGSGDSGDLVYVIEQADANPNLAGSIINFDPTVFGTPQTITLVGHARTGRAVGAAGDQWPGRESAHDQRRQCGPGARGRRRRGRDAVGSDDLRRVHNSSYGGGIIGLNFSILSISDSAISYNSTVDGIGAGIATGGTLSVVGSTFAGDTSDGGDGGGLFNVGTTTISDTSFTGDSASNVGGGIYNVGVLTLSGTTLTGDTAGNDGGGIDAQGTFTITGSTFSDDSTTNGGTDGGALEGGGTGTITASNFSGDSSYNGGALYYNGPSLLISDSTFENNSAVQGGAILNQGNLVVSATTLADNSASSAGGGILNYGTLTVTASTLSANYAGEGGGIYNQSGSTPLYVINSTIADNSAGQGGGIYNYGSNLQVTSSTIAYNVDYSGYGPGIYGQSGPVYLDNTIVAANTIGTGLGAAELDTGGIGYQSSSAYNLIGVDGSGQLSGNGNLIGITNFGLGVLGNNGGPTQTIALLAGSPAIGAGNVALAVDQNGNPLTNDQRGTGFPRTINGMVDIGAFERPTTIGAPTVYTVDLTSADGTGSGDSGDLVYVIEQADANPNLAGSIVNFDPTVFGTPQTITLSSTLELAEPSGPLVINGPGANLLTISGGNAIQVLEVAGGAVVTMSGVTISGGFNNSSYGGGIIGLNFSILSISDSAISYNSTVDGIGAGIATGGTLSVVGSTFAGDTSDGGDGGGLFNVGTTTISDTSFTGDSASNVGGGIYNVGVLTLSGSTLTGDTAGNDGGGIDAQGTFTITGSTFSDDSTTNGGTDGGALEGGGTGTITASNFSGDSSTYNGGALYYNGPSLLISDSTFENNSAVQGGAILNQGNLVVSATTLADNSASSAGGGILNYGTLTVTASTLSANYAGEGGGIYNQSGSTPLYVINSTIADNSAGQGGGIYNYGSNLQVTSSTIAYNVDYSGYGPGIYGQSGPVYLDNTIVAANTIGTGLGAAELDTGGIGYQSSRRLQPHRCGRLGPIERQRQSHRHHRFRTGRSGQ